MERSGPDGLTKAQCKQQFNQVGRERKAFQSNL